jgi:hypothetical protein
MTHDPSLRRRLLACAGGLGLTGLLVASAWDAMAATLPDIAIAFDDAIGCIASGRGTGRSMQPVG